MKESRQHKYNSLLERYNTIIAKVCYVYASEQAAFDDLYQEVCIKLWQGMDSYRGEAQVSTWIYRMAINTCITWHRHNKNHGIAVPLEQAAEIAYSTEGEHDAEQWRVFQQLLSLLEPLEKAIITLRLDGHSYDEIAAITGLSNNNVAVRLHRIKNKLMKNNPDYGPE